MDKLITTGNPKRKGKSPSQLYCDNPPATRQGISLKHEITLEGKTIKIKSLNNWEASVNEYLADLQTGIEELSNAAPQVGEKKHKIIQ